MQILDELFVRYPAINPIRDDIENATKMLISLYKSGGKLLACGNGGSAADSEHIVGELMKSFKIKRPIDKTLYDALGEFSEEGAHMRDCLEGALPAISLTSHVSLSTAFANDKEPSLVFAQQLLGLGKKNDTLIVISTSGNSKNCIYAATLAKAMGISVIAFTGAPESRLSAIADVSIRVPETETFKVQELHLPIYHAIAAALEREFF
jgi:D-sedoheptulose 7-phosphate isomerase